MVYASYSLASAMAFGVAHLSHISGQLTRALALLRPASALLRGTGDNYRRGYAQMLIGAAERARAGPDAKKLERAITSLNASLELFASSTQELSHGLHQARCHHQLALAHIYMAQAHRDQSTKKESELDQANDHWSRAKQLLEKFQDVGFDDPELQYDLALTGSRLRREQQNYTEAHSLANKARDIAEGYRYAPSYSKAKAHVAKAEVFLVQSDEQPNNSNFLIGAEGEIGKAFKTCQSNAALDAVVHLYQAKILIKQRQIHKARQTFHETWSRRGKQVQNGWVRNLASEIERETGLTKADFFLNLESLKTDLMTLDDHQPLWDAATRHFESFIVNWAEETSPREPYALLGLKRGHWFSIKRKLGMTRKAGGSPT